MLLLAVRRIQIARTEFAGKSPMAKPPPKEVGVENVTPAGAVIVLTIETAWALLELTVEEAVGSIPISTVAPLAT
jgi:hypothetical protein